MKKKKSNKHPYLNDLNDSDSLYHIVGREYLRELPVRPTNRKRRSASSTARAAPASSCVRGNIASWFRDARHAVANETSFPTILSLVIFALLVYLLRVRKSLKEYQRSAPNAAAALTTEEDALVIGRKEKNRQTHVTSKFDNTSPVIKKKIEVEVISEDSTNSSEDINESKETGIVQSCDHEHVDLAHERARGGESRQMENNSCIQDGSSQCDHDEGSRDDEVLFKTCEITITDQPRATSIAPDESLCMSDYPMETIASRWESKGLDRQKSLELAATFEMNMFFFQQIKLLLTGASFHLFDQMNGLSTKIHDQIEWNHRESMEVPKMEKLQRCREQAKYALVNMKVLNRCFFLTLPAMVYPSVVDMHPLILSPATAFSTIIAKLCPECNILISQQAGASYAPFFGIESWRSLVHQMSQASVCACRLLWCVSCLVFCRRFLPRNVTYLIVAIKVIPWMDFLMNTGAVLATNISLTLWMLKKCDEFECAAKIAFPKQSTEQIVNYYARIIPLHQSVVYVSSVVIGCIMALSV